MPEDEQLVAFSSLLGHPGDRTVNDSRLSPYPRSFQLTIQWGVELVAGRLTGKVTPLVLSTLGLVVA
jgi:hypothetical protein